MCTFLHRSFTIASDFYNFHFEVEALNETLHKNAYPTKFVGKCILKFVTNVFVQKPIVTTAPKLEVRIVLVLSSKALSRNYYKQYFHEL